MSQKNNLIILGQVLAKEKVMLLSDKQILGILKVLPLM